MNTKLRSWFLEGYVSPVEGAFEEEHKPGHHPHPWWKVMCLTGVDYFSTLGYQPGIAALAAGALSPFATAVLVLLTLLGAFPIYRRVAQESPHGEGSISMLEALLQRWTSKFFVLVLLGFVATDFVITITLSAADAAAHVRENEFVHHLLEHNPTGWQIGITLAFVLLLAAVFLKGFKEAIGIAVALVALYLALNVVVVGYGIIQVFTHPSHFSDWNQMLQKAAPELFGKPFAIQGSPGLIALAALGLFPKLALGLSGFETGVAVMPLVQGKAGEPEENPVGRVVNTQKLLLVAALIMSVFLLSSSLVTTLLIPHELFEKGGAANGRALAYLAYQFFGKVFGTAYDLSTVAILWFAGASAMAGLLNIVPRYLPRYGMAPEWTRANRPLVLVYTLIALLVTVLFKADVDAQGGAYATGVLVLMTSAAVAVTISAHRRGQHVASFAFGTITVIFAYTTTANIFERPDGMRIAACFIGTIILVSFLSRVWRVTELRVDRVELDPEAERMLAEMAQLAEVRFIANHPDTQDEAEYSRAVREAAWTHHFGEAERWAFLEVYVPDSSRFSATLRVEGVDVGGFWVLRCHGVAVPNAIAAVLLEVQKRHKRRPHVYFNWIESNPLLFLLRFVILGEGDIAPLTHEILRRAQPIPDRRPIVHAAG